MLINDYNWIILGAGAVVKQYHLPAFEYLNLLNKVTVIDLSESNLMQISESYKGIKTIQSDSVKFIESCQNLNNTNAIVALPNHMHKIASELLAMKGANVLCEKPISLTRSELDDLHKISIDNNRLISSAMVRRYMPSYQALLDRVKDKKIIEIIIEDGAPYAWVANSREFFAKRNGGVLADIGVHYLDLLVNMLGDLQLIEYEDDFEGGVEANCNCVLSSNEIKIIMKLSRTKFLGNKFRIITDEGEFYILKDDFEACYFVQNDLIHKIKKTNAFNFNIAYDFSSCFVEQLYHFITHSKNNNIEFIAPKSQFIVVDIIEKAYKRHIYKIKNSGLKTLITGGSGFIGTELIKSFVEEGRHVVAPMNSYNKCADIARYDIEMPKLNLFDIETLNTQLSGVKQVIHLAYSSNEETALKVNVQGTRNIVNAAIKNGVESIVILSTMYVFGHHDTDAVLDEKVGYHPYGGIYAESKLAMEKWCLERSRNSGNTRIVILNPTCVYGPNGKTYSRLPNDLVKQNKFAWIDNGNGIVNYVFIHNLIDAIMLALNNPKAHGNNFIINDGHTTWKDFINNQLVVKSNHIPNLNSNQRNTSAKFNKSILQVLKSLMMNYEVLELINSNKVLFKIKKSFIKLLPKSKQSIQIERSISAVRIKTINEIHHNPPEWLFDLFPNTKTRYSSNKAKNILGWNSRIEYEDSMNITSIWLKDFYNIKN